MYQFNRTLIAAISSLAISLIVSTPSLASSFSEAITNGKVDGELRTVLYARSADGLSGDGVTYLGKASGVAVGGFIGYTTQAYNHLTARIAGYTAQPVVGNGQTLSRSNLVNGEDGFSFIGQAYINYDDSVYQVKIGRQDMYTPIVASDDGRVIKDLFSGISASTKRIPNHTISFFYLNEMSGVDNGNEKKDWESMSKVLGASYDKGMYGLGLDNMSIPDLNIKAWYYQIPDTVSIVFAGAKYNQKVSNDFSLSYEGHYWQSKSKDTYELDTSSFIDYYYAGARVSASIKDFTLQVAYDHMAKDALSKTIHEYHGNFAEYTYGFLLGSGAYGAALAPTNPNNMTEMDAVKLTGIYKASSDTTILVGYMMANSDDSNYQSDVNIMDIALFANNIAYDNVSLALIYENWDADGNNFFIDNHLIRATLKYKF